MSESDVNHTVKGQCPSACCRRVSEVRRGPVQSSVGDRIQEESEWEWILYYAAPCIFYSRLAKEAKLNAIISKRFQSKHTAVFH